MSLMTSLLFSILTDNVGMQQEQQIVIKFLVAGVTNAEIYHRLAAVFKDDCLSSSRVFEWCTHFCDGRQHVTSQSPKKFKVQPSTGKIMFCIFWNSQRLILVDFVPPGITLNANCYISLFSD